MVQKPMECFMSRSLEFDKMEKILTEKRNLLSESYTALKSAIRQLSK